MLHRTGPIPLAKNGVQGDKPESACDMDRYLTPILIGGVCNTDGIEQIQKSLCMRDDEIEIMRTLTATKECYGLENEPQVKDERSQLRMRDTP